MTESKLELSIALSENENTRAILDGRIQPDAIKLHATPLHPSEMFWRQLKFAEFDVSEMSMSSLTIATSQGRRVGVPEYQQTAAIWSRGVLQHEFGVHPREIEFFMERTPETSHGGATGFKAPEGVTIHQIPLTTNIGEMMVRGELDATLLYLTHANLVDRSRINLASDTRIKPLFERAAEAKRYFAKTGIYQINHGMVIRRPIFERHPWAALNIYNAFAKARGDVIRARDISLLRHFEPGLIGDDVRKALATDPMAYGVKGNRKVLETITQYVHEHGLSTRRVALEEMFATSTMDL